MCPADCSAFIRVVFSQCHPMLPGLPRASPSPVSFPLSISHMIIFYAIAIPCSYPLSLLAFFVSLSPGRYLGSDRSIGFEWKKKKSVGYYVEFWRVTCNQPYKSEEEITLIRVKQHRRLFHGIRSNKYYHRPHQQRLERSQVQDP